MAKRRRKTKSNGWLTRVRQRMGSELTARQALWLTCMVCGAAAVALAGWGLGRLEAYVHGLPEYQRPVSVELVGIPDWLNQAQNRHILDSVRRTARVTENDNILDEQLAERIGLAIGDCGWVSHVLSVDKSYGGIVRVRCEFRKPLAWIVYGDAGYLIDDECVRLPGMYAPGQMIGTGLVQILGVDAEPVDPGEVWPGEDLHSAIEVAHLVKAQDFGQQIRGVLVYNYGGRRNAYEPHIELATDRPGSRIRWGRAPGEELGIEITAAQKVTLLSDVYRKYHRVDMGQPYVDIRHSPTEVYIPLESGDSVGSVGALRS